MKLIKIINKYYHYHAIVSLVFVECAEYDSSVWKTAVAGTSVTWLVGRDSDPILGGDSTSFVGIGPVVCCGGTMRRNRATISWWIGSSSIYRQKYTSNSNCMSGYYRFIG